MADENLAKILLERHGYMREPRPGEQPLVPLKYQQGRVILCPSKNSPKDTDICSLQLEEKVRAERAARLVLEPSPPPLQCQFKIASTYCGYWDYRDTELVFVPQYLDDREGLVYFGNNCALLDLQASAIWPESCRVEIFYQILETVFLGHYSNPTVTFTAQAPPKFFGPPNLNELVNALFLDPISRSKRTPQWYRLEGMSPLHHRVAGMCFVYQITLKKSTEIAAVSQILKSHPRMPPSISMATNTLESPLNFHVELDRLEQSLQSGRKYGLLAFSVKFQVIRLAVNGYLPPRIVSLLLPHIESFSSIQKPLVLAEAIRRLSNRINYAGPDNDGRQFKGEWFVQELETIIQNFHDQTSMYELEKRHKHLVLIHRVTVTPTQTYLDGPEPEVSCEEIP
jgi:hypothetical protein